MCFEEYVYQMFSFLRVTVGKISILFKLSDCISTLLTYFRLFANSFSNTMLGSGELNM